MQQSANPSVFYTGLWTFTRWGGDHASVSLTQFYLHSRWGCAERASNGQRNVPELASASPPTAMRGAGLGPAGQAGVGRGAQGAALGLAAGPDLARARQGRREQQGKGEEDKHPGRAEPSRGEGGEARAERRRAKAGRGDRHCHCHCHCRAGSLSPPRARPPHPSPSPTPLRRTGGRRPQARVHGCRTMVRLPPPPCSRARPPGP